MGFKIKNSLTGEFEKLPILTLKGEKGETGGVEEYNKVDYMGNKYETLKQANDANVEYAVKTAIGEFNYLDYDGQHITATDTIEGRSKSAILTGSTKYRDIDTGEILDVFDDPYFYEIFDKNHSDIGQDRFFGLGCMNGIFIVATSYIENERIHIISARLASPKEKMLYDEYCRKING